MVIIVWYCMCATLNLYINSQDMEVLSSALATPNNNEQVYELSKMTVAFCFNVYF